MKKLMFALFAALLFMTGNLFADTFEGIDRDNGLAYYSGPRGGRYYINANGKKTYSVKSELVGSILENKIYTGSRGGRYYINCNGNKTYIPRKKGERSSYSYNTSSSKRSCSYSYNKSSSKRSSSYSYKKSSFKRSSSYSYKKSKKRSRRR